MLWTYDRGLTFYPVSPNVTAHTSRNNACRLRIGIGTMISVALKELNTCVTCGHRDSLLRVRVVTVLRH